MFKRSSIAILAAAFAVPAMADIGGGGATLPAKAYHGSNASSTSSGSRLSSPTADSLFGVALPFVNQSYCQTGSGTGRSVLTGTSSNTDASRPCPATFTDSFVNGTNGFSAPSIDADFAGSDAPAGTADFNAFITNKANHIQMTQFPSVAGAISVIANPPGTAAAPVSLTEAEVCNIFAGKLTNWNQIARPTGAPFGNAPIKLVVRSDSSGTTFGFTNHLNWVCSDAALSQTLSPGASALPLSPNFSVVTTFSPGGFPGGVAPAGVIAASGNPGVVSTVAATDGAIGYAEAANAAAISSPGLSLVKIAAKDSVELNAKDGVNTARAATYVAANLNTATFTVPTTFVDKDGKTYNGTYTDRALQANNPTYGRPVGLPTALTTAQAPNANCVFIVHPGAYATSGYKTAGDANSGYKQYPIVAVTYLMGNYAMNGNSADMATLLASPYDTTLRTSVKTVGAKTGYSYLSPIKGKPLSGALVTLDAARVDACTN